MKVITQHKVFDSEKEPMKVVINDLEKKFFMMNTHTFILAPNHMRKETAEQKLHAPIPERKKRKKRKK